MPQPLFVYGTLRFEYPNPLAVKLKSQAIFICKGSAPGVLYDLGWYPGAVFNDDVRTRVIGEVIALGNAERLMAQLDDYEAIELPAEASHRERRFYFASSAAHRTAESSPLDCHLWEVLQSLLGTG